MSLTHEVEGKKLVTWVVFQWVIGLFFTVLFAFGMYVSASFNHADGVQVQFQKHESLMTVDLVKIQTQLSQIQTDILWLKSNLIK